MWYSGITPRHRSPAVSSSTAAMFRAAATMFASQRNPLRAGAVPDVNSSRANIVRAGGLGLSSRNGLGGAADLQLESSSRCVGRRPHLQHRQSHGAGGVRARRPGVGEHRRRHASRGERRPKLQRRRRRVERHARRGRHHAEDGDGAFRALRQDGGHPVARSNPGRAKPVDDVLDLPQQPLVAQRRTRQRQDRSGRRRGARVFCHKVVYAIRHLSPNTAVYRTGGPSVEKPAAAARSLVQASRRRPRLPATAAYLHRRIAKSGKQSSYPNRRRPVSQCTGRGRSPSRGDHFCFRKLPDVIAGGAPAQLRRLRRSPRRPGRRTISSSSGWRLRCVPLSSDRTPELGLAHVWSSRGRFNPAVDFPAGIPIECPTGGQAFTEASGHASRSAQGSQAGRVPRRR